MSKNDMRRRDFVKLCGTAGLGFAAPVGLSSISSAEDATADQSPYEGPYYVVFNASGGWDTTRAIAPHWVTWHNWSIGVFTAC
jgi:hypothetical protein